MELVIDTSAIMAILQSEEEARLLLGVVVAADRRRMSAASYVELGVVTDRSGEPRLVELMDRFLHTAEIEIEPVTVRQAQVAREAHSRYGRRSGHPAKLNFGDCFSYALAMELGHPLLFKGGDFAQTDVLPALA